LEKTAEVNGEFPLESRMVVSSFSEGKNPEGREGVVEEEEVVAGGERMDGECRLAQGEVRLIFSGRVFSTERGCLISVWYSGLRASTLKELRR